MTPVTARALSGRALIVVLGMHRSGTSALARALPVFGVGLGDRLMPAVERDNDKGFWEDLDLNEVNIDVLGALGAEWHSTGAITEMDFRRESVQALRSRAIGVLGGKFAGTPAFALKDPRLSRLLPFWKPIFHELALQTSYILAIRNPMSVARSLQMRNGMQIDKSYELWLQHCLEALSGTRGEPRLCVDYDELMLDAPRQLSRLGRFLGRVPEPSAADEYCLGFLERRLRRSRHFMGDLEAEAGVDSPISRLYGMLRRAAVDDRPQVWTPIERFLEQTSAL